MGTWGMRRSVMRETVEWAGVNPRERHAVFYSDIRLSPGPNLLSSWQKRAKHRIEQPKV
jgi:hypothetical protein